MAAMNTQTPVQKRVGVALTTIALIFAVWLVSPFIRIQPSDYAHAKILAYRLFLGLMILIVFIGKTMFDALAPQGLARRVSSAKGVALVVLAMVLLGFVVYIVGQATVLYLNAAAREQQQQQSINYLP